MALKDYISNKPVIETERLVIRPLIPSDAESMKEWTPDKSIYTYWGKGPGKADKDPSLLFTKPEKETKSFHLGIASKETDEVMGEIWIYLIENDRMAKVAVRFGKQYHGKGYATESLKAMVQFCFTHTELKRIWTDVDVRNIASCRILEKCGFTREGLIRQGKMVSTWCDYYIYGIIFEDFEDKLSSESL